MPGLALFIAWNQVATSAALLGMALVAHLYNGTSKSLLPRTSAMGEQRKPDVCKRAGGR
ncbi:hypothetical protein U91I_01498 [alpha proteobacterium U9-1i]|nr:hypothetical protein U91I_01498 [alpha proteobacterium U9-1i]